MITVYGQPYKIWFVNQTSAGCPGCAVGIVNHPDYNDSLAMHLAFREACKNYVKQQRSRVILKKKSREVQSGIVGIENSFHELIDSADWKKAIDRLVILDTLLSRNFAAVLVGPENCTLNTVATLTLKREDIVSGDACPDTAGRVFTGSAPEYYYEKSTWDEAEKMARKEAALFLEAKIKATGNRKNGIYDEQQQMDSNVELKHAYVCRRWIDKKTNLFFVSVRLE